MDLKRIWEDLCQSCKCQESQKDPKKILKNPERIPNESLEHPQTILDGSCKKNLEGSPKISLDYPQSILNGSQKSVCSIPKRSLMDPNSNWFDPNKASSSILDGSQKYLWRILKQSLMDPNKASSIFWDPSKDPKIRFRSISKNLPSTNGWKQHKEKKKETETFHKQEENQSGSGFYRGNLQHKYPLHHYFIRPASALDFIDVASSHFYRSIKRFSDFLVILDDLKKKCCHSLN